MSDLETVARPLLEPMIADTNRVSLTSTEQGLVARWAVKTTLLLGYVERPAHPASPARLSWVRQKDGAPLLTWVYLAAMAPGGPTFRGRLHFNTYTNEARIIEGGTFRVATLLLRRLVVQVLQMDLVTQVTAEPDNPTAFNEIAIQVSKPAQEVIDTLAAKGVIGGVAMSRLNPKAGMDDVIIACATETNTDDDIRTYANALKEVLA